MNKLLLLLLPVIALSSCGKSAQSSMESFCDDLSAGRWEKALGTFGDANAVRTVLTDLEEEAEKKALAGAMFGGSRCSVKSTENNVVMLDVDAVNAQAITAGVMADSIGMAFMSAFSGPDGERAMKEAVLAKLMAGLSAQDAPRRQMEVAIAMEEVDGRWMPANAERLLSAISGGMDNLSFSE